jgi:hypothetical protein
LQTSADLRSKNVLRLETVPSDYTFVPGRVETELDGVPFMENETSTAVSDVHPRFYYS